jgi:hypothetical protein
VGDRPADHDLGPFFPVSEMFLTLMSLPPVWDVWLNGLDDFARNQRVFIKSIHGA